jgi:catechol 2,3-dioxygenase-like lactoylglutathione lyase family enzyme
MTLSFQRTSVFCRDLESSLGFYRDLLGLVPVEEKTIEGAAAGALLQLPPCRMRIALLAVDLAADPVVGLFEVGGVPLEAVNYPRAGVGFGQTAILFATHEFDAVHARLEAAGAHFLTPPVRYPKRTASARSPAGIYREMIVRDPDGQLVGIMQIEPLPEEAQS